MLFIVFPCYLKPNTVLYEHPEPLLLICYVVTLVYPFHSLLPAETPPPILFPFPSILVPDFSIFVDAPTTFCTIPPLPVIDIPVLV